MEIVNREELFEKALEFELRNSKGTVNENIKNIFKNELEKK